MEQSLQRRDTLERYTVHVLFFMCMKCGYHVDLKSRVYVFTGRTDEETYFSATFKKNPLKANIYIYIGTSKRGDSYSIASVHIRDDNINVKL